MKLLITGGCGFIGSAVVKHGLALGHEIINIDCLTYAANPQNLAAVADNPQYHFENINICDSQAVKQCLELYKPDAIMHLAAESHVDRSIDGPAAFIQTNIIGTFTLLEACLEYWRHQPSAARDRFRFHHVSTDEVYGDLEFDDPSFTEMHPYNPSSPYSASKASSDHLVRAWARTYGLPTILSNCSNNYGPYQFPEKLIPVTILKALHGKKIPIYGTGENIRDWLYVDDHADALLCVLTKGRLGETYNIGGNNERSNLDVVKAICAIVDRTSMAPVKPAESLIEFVTDRPGHDKRYAINAEKITTELGWTPSMVADEGFEKTVQWYCDHEAWWRPLIKAGQFGQRLGHVS